MAICSDWSIRWSTSNALGSAISAALLAGFTSLATAQFVPNETRVSPNAGLIDFEFSQSRARVVWTDPQGDLWLARVNTATGAFEPVTGKGLLIASNTVAKSNMFKWNGPEWLAGASGDQIVYSYYLPGMPKSADNTRMALAVQDQSGAWVSQTLSPELPRMAHITSRDPGDTNARISYLDPDLNHYWRNVKDPGSETPMPFLPPSNRAWRFASEARALVFSSPVDGVWQAFTYTLDSGAIKQMTFDAGNKDDVRTVPWMWRAPEFGGDYVLSTVVNQNELRIYRKLAGTGGVMQWTPVYSAVLPAGRTMGSPEWFVYNGRSYLSLAVFVGSNTFPSEVWISGIDASFPLFRRVTDDSVLRVRNDPEVFITDRGPYVYYNRYDPSVDPDHPLCNRCSEGVYRADTGLLGR